MADVTLVSPITLDEIFKAELDAVNFDKSDIKKTELRKVAIPDYQRIYCWEEKNVYQLLEDVMNNEPVLHLGNIIVHKSTTEENKEVFDIIDGQQRLVTLSLILYCLEKNEDANPLLNETFKSEIAESYIKYNYHIINNYLINHYKINNVDIDLANQIREKVRFSLLILNTESVDLAYTFFSSQNSLGVKLTDYDLLKSHHLRYVYYPKQAVHVAKNWDRILLTKDKDLSIQEIMGRYLFRLRQWYRHDDWNDKKVYKVKNEFEAALILPEVPPFGERFLYYEPIQGGTHFFAYTDIFIDKCKLFHNTSAYKSLNKQMWWSSLKVFKEVIDVLLFGYYLKFGDYYLSEALYCISRIISDYRFKEQRYNYKTLLKIKYNKDIVEWIEISTSPTFFLANCIDLINKKMNIDDNSWGKKGIRQSYYNQLLKMFNEIKVNITSSSVLTSLEKLFDKK